MGNGLTLGLFMTTATLCGMWLWRTGAVRRLGQWTSGPLVGVLALVTLMCKNMGALTLLLLGLVGLFATRWFRTRMVILALAAAAPLYMLVRTTGGWSGAPLTSLARLVHERRAESLQYRFDNENLLIAKALQQPWFGWGGWGRNRVYEEDWQGDLKDVSTTDGLWIISFGINGLVGLAALTAIQSLPPLLLLKRWPARTWSCPDAAAPAALATILLLSGIDNLFNAMVNPIYMLIAGGLTSLCVLRRSEGAARLGRGLVTAAAQPHGVSPNHGRTPYRPAPESRYEHRVPHRVP
jgi:O-antigen ligase